MEHPKVIRFKYPKIPASYGRFIPFPCIIVEQWLTTLSHNELRVLIYICRRTWYYRKEADTITLDQFVNGVTARNGTKVDSGCGCSQSSVQRALASLEKHGLVRIQRRGRHASLYSLTSHPLIGHSSDQLKASS